MDVLICFNPNKPTHYKERLLTKFIEYPFENALEQLENNNNYPKNQQICNGTLNMISILQSFNKYPFSLVCLLDNYIIGIVILDIHELSLIVGYICVNKYKKKQMLEQN